MKIITIFILLSAANSHALTNRECRHGVAECGYKARNKKLFCKHMTAAQRACVESKISSLQAKQASMAAKANKKKQARKNIKAFDCDTLTGIQKDMCWRLK